MLTEQTENPKPKVSEREVTSKTQPEQTEKPEVKKSEKPLIKDKITSPFGIQSTFKKIEEQENALKMPQTEEHLPSSHFSETDLQTEWNLFIQQLRRDDIVIYSAINGFQLSKIDEDTILVSYPSETAKSEFDKIQAKFFNHFKHKVNHFNIKIEFKMNIALKQEVMTKRKLFDKLIEINPLLKNLDEMMKFDFS